MEKIITKNLLPGRSYRVRATGVDSSGKTITSQVYIVQTKGKSQAPPNVNNLSADFKGLTLVITWNGDSARAEKDFKHFRIKITSPNHSGITKNYYTDSNILKFQEDQNRGSFGSFEKDINITVYSIDRTGNQSSGVSISISAEPPSDPTNVKLSAATLGYNISWDLPTFTNYKETRVYHSDSEDGTYVLARSEYGASTYVPLNTLAEKWVKVAHVNVAGVESNRVASVPPSIIPIDPVPTDVTPPEVPTNLNFEAVGTEDINGITTATMRAHWEVSEITSGYKVRVTEDTINKSNWAVYDVPATKATVTNKQISSNVATLTLSAHSFAVDDYVTVFDVGSPFNGKYKITSVVPNVSISFNLTSSNIPLTESSGSVILSSYTIKELYPGTSYIGSILAYDSANNITQFVAEGPFTTPGTPAVIGKPIRIDGTTMAFGPDVSGTNDGLFINSNNYWYNTGYFNVGTATNSLSWNGTRLRLDGAITARSGSFSGNVFLAGQNLENDSTASLIAAPYYEVQSASWSGGTATVILSATPNPAWSVGDIIIISEASRDFDGQYILSSASGSTITFLMSSDSATIPSITNRGKITRVNAGDRVIFNSYGIQAWEDNAVSFSLNRNRTSKIGGWTIRPARIFAGLGSNAVGLNSSSGSNVRIYAGNEDPDTAPFKLMQSGNIQIQRPDSSNRVTIGANLSGDRAGILIDDSSSSGISNFWYLPSTVNINSNYFRVGTDTGSAIVVKKTGTSTSKVIIKDYEIEGDNNVVSDSRINVGGIKIGRNLNSTTKDGIWVDDDNYWYDPDSVSSNTPMFKVRGGNQSITVNKGQNIVFTGTIAGSISTGPITTPNDFKFGNNVVGGTKDGLYFNENNFWLLPNSAIATGEVFFQIAGGSAQGTYIQIKKGTTSTTGDVYIKGYYAGGQITEPITTPPTTGGTPGNMSLGADVDGTKDGLKLSANNYWYVPESVTDGTAIFRVGGATNFLSYNPTGDTLSLTGNITAASGNIGSWLVGSDSISSTGSPTYPIVLKNDVSNPRIYIGAGAHASTTTPFYADSAGRFSIGDKLFFDPSDSQSFGTLTVIGRIRGAIDNIPIIPTDSGNFTVSSVVISGTTPNQTAVLTTTATHTFAVGDTVIVSGLTGNAASANGAWGVSVKTTNTFTITGISGATNGTYTGQSGTARVRELTMGLHPAFNGSPPGLGIRMDEYNYWFVNNQFRVGTSGSYFKWDGATLTVKGRVEADSGYFPAGLITGTLTASQINTTGLTTQYLNTSSSTYNVRVEGANSLISNAVISFYQQTPFSLNGFITSNADNALNLSGLSSSIPVTLQTNNTLFIRATNGIYLLSPFMNSIQKKIDNITSEVAVSRVVSNLPLASEVQNGEIIMVV